MIVRQRVKRAVVAGTLGLAVATGGIATASTAQAADTGTDTISCSAVKVHASYSTGSTTVGVAYKGDKITYKQWVYQRSAKTWWVNGTVTRKSDHKKIRGYVVYQCANPYNTWPAPTPPIPK
ncbi:hypothetical protein OG413_45395 [Streptomyces sp. NBC_01433]|uniref:hypothetical protein n=1 Tax=Streptomyces sp. NBC_01433 TaxID=2903864 RepID=UPI00225BF6A4|nr:hypothetical protein [Streptomyces sp. NBC_01433]MCX4681346.1 hypothetical protein [Streptomyces sp. NBC_01433]MCX4681716.1 hypothetical protein [Streptomyces sp. NBC_01433]MCX4682422.1 hypothetical protein [Streptomyces sp. NBC_01433]